MILEHVVIGVISQADILTRALNPVQFSDRKHELIPAMGGGSLTVITPVDHRSVLELMEGGNGSMTDNGVRGGERSEGEQDIKLEKTGKGAKATNNYRIGNTGEKLLSPPQVAQSLISI